MDPGFRRGDTGVGGGDGGPLHTSAFIGVHRRSNPFFSVTSVSSVVDLSIAAAHNI
jgi:hypothetical protein